MLTSVALVTVLAAPQIGAEQLDAAARVAGLELTDAELEQMVRGARRNLRSYAQLRARSLPNSVVPALRFAPIRDPRAGPAPDAPPPTELVLPDVERPAELERLAFAGIRELAALVKSRKVRCRELVDLCLRRLEEGDAKLACVVTLTAERALRRADELDAMLERGEWLGPLHAIPFGAKDLLSARGHPTTWGAKPYAEQVIDADAAVIRQLEARGAILVAKLSLGALAMGDVWFRGRTNNPWNHEQGSSGSSAGSAAATAAGLVPFAIGSETLGSIVSPAARCGCTGLRPTFGVVPTAGAMTLSWSMDKLGPLCRSADDAALVFDAMWDRGLAGYAFAPTTEIDPRRLKIGYVPGDFEGRGRYAAPVLEQLRAMGAELVEIELPDYPLQAMRIVLGCEAAAAFDELTRSNRDDELTRQDPGAWPTIFRVARLVPAVEYIQAQRLRTLLMHDMEKAIARVDLYVHPSHGGVSLTLTNLTGHPTIVCPLAPREGRGPGAISFTGKLYGERTLIALARAWQSRTGYHREHPPAWK